MLSKNYLLKYSVFTFVIVLTGISISCREYRKAEQNCVVVKGSDTMLNLAELWAEQFMRTNKGVSVQITGGGSGTGIASLLNGTSEIALSSRELKKKEIESALVSKIKYHTLSVALDGLAVIVNKNCGVDSLTIEQIRDIFVGGVKNYKELGGNDLSISLYGRESSSGTYEFFKEHILGRNPSGRLNDFSASVQVLQGTASLAEAVSKDKHGIGYGGVGYFAQRDDIKIVKIKRDKSSLAVSPIKNGKIDYECIWGGKYPIARDMYLIYTDRVSNTAKKFTDFILSDEGRKIVEKSEYIPIPKK